MRKNTIYFSTLILALLVATKSLTYTSGPGGGYTNAPSENNCTSCHSGSLITSGTNWAKINLTGNFISGKYKADSTYAVKLSYKQSSINKFGFQITALDTNNKPVGTLSTFSNRVQKKTRIYGSNTRQYLLHTTTGTSTTGTDSTDWQFRWKAPKNYQGNVKFYAVVMAANANSQNSGDQVYAKTFRFKYAQDSVPITSIGANRTTLCAEEAVYFSATASANPTAYDWKINGGNMDSSNQQNPGNIFFPDAGVFYVSARAKNKNGFGPYDSIKITVLAKPKVKWLSNENQNLCAGDSINLLAQYTPGAKYQWSDGQSGNSIWVKDSGSYFFTVSKSGCKNVSSTRFVQKFENPEIVLKNSLYCQSLKEINLDANQVLIKKNVDSSYWTCLDCKNLDSVLRVFQDTTYLSLSRFNHSNQGVDTISLIHHVLNVQGCHFEDTAQIIIVASPSISYKTANPACFNQGTISLGSLFSIQPPGGVWKVIDTTGFDKPSQIGVPKGDSIQVNSNESQKYKDAKFLLQYKTMAKGCEAKENMTFFLNGMDSIYSSHFSFGDTLYRCDGESPFPLDAMPEGGEWLLNNKKVEEGKQGIFEVGNTIVRYVFSNSKTGCVSQKSSMVVTYPSPRLNLIRKTDTCLAKGMHQIALNTLNENVDSASFSVSLNNKKVQPLFSSKDSIVVAIIMDSSFQWLKIQVDTAVKKSSICPLLFKDIDSFQLKPKPMAKIAAKKQPFEEESRFFLSAITDVKNAQTDWKLQPMEGGFLQTNDSVVSFLLSQTANKQYVDVDLEIIDQASQCKEKTDSTLKFDQITFVNNIQIKKIAFYPNPVKNHIFLQEIKEGYFNIFNASGQEVLTGTVKNGKIDVKALSAGTFILQIHTLGFLRFSKN